MKELVSFTSRFEATVFAQQLDEAGIAYIIQSNDGSGMFPVGIEIEPVKIMVSDSDYESAKKFVEE
jgi:hypothetical protein